MIANHSRTIRRSLALPLSGAVLALAATGAVAKPIGSGDPPIPPNAQPVAKLKVSPKIALVSTLPEISVKAKAGLGDLGVLGAGGDLVKFDASSSTDADGDALTYDWDLDGDGAFERTGKGPMQETRYFSPGTFETKVRARDGVGGFDVVKQTVIVHRAPSAKIAADETVPLVGQTVNFSAAASTADPHIGAVEWDLDGDGTFETNTGTGLAASSSYQTPGSRTVKVKITDVYGESDTASITEKVNQLPTAAFTNGPAVAGAAVAFDGSASTDDSAIANYAWDLDDNGSFETDGGASPLTSKTFPTVGTRTVRLRVTDELGGISVVSRAIVVGAAPASGQTGTPSGAQPGSPLADKVAPLITLSKRTFKLSRTGKIAVRVACPAGEASCKGTVKIRIGKAKPKTIATGRFVVVGGTAKTLNLAIPSAQRRSIRRGSKLNAKAIIAVADAAGNERTSTVGILIGI